MTPLEFASKFIAYYENTGIYDEFDREANAMKTSDGVKNLYQLALATVPKRMNTKDNAEAANAMRELSEEHKDSLIAQDTERKVIDLRTEFAKRMSANRGAQGILAQLVEAADREDVEGFRFLMKDAEGIVKGPENVTEDL